MGGPVELTFDSREAQTWGGGKVVISDKGRGDIKRAKKEGRLAEAMLDRRAAMKRYVSPGLSSSSKRASCFKRDIGKNQADGLSDRYAK